MVHGKRILYYNFSQELLRFIDQQERNDYTYSTPNGISEI